MLRVQGVFAEDDAPRDAWPAIRKQLDELAAWVGADDVELPSRPSRVALGHEREVVAVADRRVAVPGRHEHRGRDAVEHLRHQCPDRDDLVGSPRTIPGGARSQADRLSEDRRAGGRAAPDGITRTRPVTTSPRWGWFASTISPVAGSSPPQKLSGSARTSAVPSTCPSTRNRPSISRPRALRRGSRPRPPPTGRSPRGYRGRRRRRDCSARTTPTCRSRS